MLKEVKDYIATVKRLQRLGDKILDEYYTNGLQEGVTTDYISEVECMKEHLTESEFFVIESRFGLRDGKRYTLENVGLNMGVTRERIRQIETKAIRKLQRKCKDLIIYLR